MPDTIREQILVKLADRCQVLSNNPVERCRRSMPSSKEPFITVWDGTTTVTGQSYGASRLAMQVVIEAAWIPVDEPSTEASALMGLIEHTILSADTTFGGLATDMQWLSSQPGYPTDGSNVVTAQVALRIDYATPTGDPYQVAE